MQHLFLTALIALKLWREIAVFAGIDIKEMNLQEIIMTWWTMKATTKLEAVSKAMPIIIMWNVWKRRNAIKHGGYVRYEELLQQVQEIIRKLTKKLYPWIKMGKENWPEIVNKLRRYKPITLLLCCVAVLRETELQVQHGWCKQG